MSAAFHESSADVLRRLRRNVPQVRDAMKLRCEEAGHEWEPAMSASFELLSVCRWCDARSAALPA